MVKLTDLNDYLNPAQDCIVIPTNNKAGEKKELETGVKKSLKLTMEDDMVMEVKKPNLIKASVDGGKATVNLYDCLACSGCVTSSEVILMEVA